MLQFTHDGNTIDVDLDGLPLHEGLALQKATGHRMPDFLAAIQGADMEAFAALGWVLVKFRCGKPDVTFEDVCEGRVPIKLSDFDDPHARAQAEAQEAAAGNGQGPARRGARAKTRT
ncbi:hypothetical protein ACIBEJ_34295 [Nonomuraea sp. NPDC050790]|uniref:hypothetical protein n=1 Tax=Nonomuraea sp. NPDC050790 TaxID=3364371 RepID=UPI003794FB56